MVFGKKETTTDFVASLKDMNPLELKGKIKEIRGEIMVERIKVKDFGTGYAQKGGGAMRQLKRDLARALTIQRERRR